MIAENLQPIGATLDRSLVAPGESAESGLDQFIETRHRQRVKSEGERDEEAAWRESERRHTAARRAENAFAWAEYHRGQADRLRASMAALIEHHEAEAQRYLPKVLTKGAP